MMLDAKLEQWIKDFEAKFDKSDNVRARDYKPIEFIYDLRNKSVYLWIENANTKFGTEEIIYCYIPSNKQGLILKRENDRRGSMASYVNYVSYGNISQGDFVNNELHSTQKMNQILENILALLSWVPTFQ
jgi:hypothetical protein